MVFGLKDHKRCRHKGQDKYCKRAIAKYNNPTLLITENGAPFTDVVEGGAVHDPLRVDYLQAHVQTALRAIEDGVDLRGYFVWSLMDNFEWANGYNKRFGLIYVDHKSQERIIKDSGYWYRDFIARQNETGI